MNIHAKLTQYWTQKNIRILNAMIVQLLSHLAVLIPLMFQFLDPKGQNIKLLTN